MDAAFIWALAATFAAGIQVFSQKVVAHEKRDSALNGIFGYGVSALIGAVALFFFYDVPDSWRAILILSTLSGLVHATGSYFRIEALKHIDAVIYFPLNKVIGPILVVAIGVWWFGDALSLYQYIGIGLSLTVPLLLVSSAEKHRQNNLWLGIILLVVSTVLTALTTPLQEAATTFDPTIMFTLVVSQCAGALISTAIYARLKAKEQAFFNIHFRDLQLGLFNGVLQFISFVTFLKALSLGLVSIVYVIHAHYILIPIILSVWWYKDHINTRKLIAIIVSSVAITLLS